MVLSTKERQLHLKAVANGDQTANNCDAGSVISTFEI